MASQKISIKSRSKYCRRGETPALATREPNGRIYVTLPADVLASLLEAARAAHTRKDVANG